MPQLGKWKVGDVVRLKSGGAAMTVVGPGTTEGYAWCEWQDASGRHHGHAYPEDALVRAGSAAGPLPPGHGPGTGPA